MPTRPRVLGQRTEARTPRRSHTGGGRCPAYPATFGLSQEKIHTRYGFSVETIRNYEQGIATDRTGARPA